MRLNCFVLNGILWVLIVVCESPSLAQGAPAATEWLASLPKSAAGLASADLKRFEAASEKLDQWASRQAWEAAAAGPDGRLVQIRALIDAKRSVDDRLSLVLSWRVQTGTFDRESVCRYLDWTSRIISLSGRLRYALRDAIEQATYSLSDSPPALERLIALLADQRVAVAAEELSYVLENPAPDSTARPFPAATKRKILSLIAAARSPAMLEDLNDFMEARSTTAELMLDAAEAVRAIGLPQTPSPNSRADAAAAAPEISARGLQVILERLQPKRLSPADQQRLRSLTNWLDDRIERGVREDSYRVGPVDVRAGDWVLMRNPSPYNRFTSHQPGLFTHVGIVTVEQDADGVRRFVVVDIPERGDHIPATNVEAFVGRTLHYLILRHPNQAVAAKMSDVARSLIGNESQFDLQFQTSRVEALRGKPLAEALIHTYCAGLLLLVAQETGQPVADFFPVREGPAEGKCADNLRKLGLAIGEDFVSPTGALFSSKLELVGQCEPMYEPEREIRDVIYDSFARAMVERELVPSPTLTQSLRARLAGLAMNNPWLARALAKANQVSPHTDLESAARAAAVIESLDEVVQQASTDFGQARLAITAANDERPRKAAEAKQFDMLRQRHSALVRRFAQNQLSPRVLRLELVAYYTREGVRRLDERFFETQTPSPPTRSP